CRRRSSGHCAPRMRTDKPEVQHESNVLRCSTVCSYATRSSARKKSCGPRKESICDVRDALRPATFPQRATQREADPAPSEVCGGRWAARIGCRVADVLVGSGGGRSHFGRKRLESIDRALVAPLLHSDEPSMTAIGDCRIDR